MGLIGNMHKYFLAASLLFIPLFLTAQNESFPCNCCNTNLKVLFKGEVLKQFYVHYCYGSGLQDLSSSFLIPEGTPPEIIENTDGPPDDAAYVNWTCRYSVGSISDSNTKTAWAEGIDGPGIGEVLIVPCLNLKKPAKIWVGYGKSDSTFFKNNRPKKLRTVIVRAEFNGATQSGIIYENLVVFAERIFSLEDKNGFQNLPIPEYTVDSYFSSRLNNKSDYKYFLGIEILDIYPGSKYDDTCISEITNE